MPSQRSSANCAGECGIGVSAAVVSLFSLFLQKLDLLLQKLVSDLSRKRARASGYSVSRSRFGSELYPLASQRLKFGRRKRRVIDG
jgi:hypothetical protein